MKSFRVQLTIRWLMIAVAVSSLFIALYVKYRPRPTFYKQIITMEDHGFTFQCTIPTLNLKSLFGSGVGDTSRGTKIFWVELSEGSGAGRLLEYEEGSMRLYSDNQDYGPLSKGDVIDFGSDWIRINGRDRIPVPASPKRKPTVRTAGNRLMPGEVVIHGALPNK